MTASVIGIIGWGFLILVIAALAGGILYVVWRIVDDIASNVRGKNQKILEERRIQAMPPEEREYYEAKKEYDERIAFAKGKLDRICSDLTANAVRAGRELADARQTKVHTETRTGPPSTTTKRNLSAGGAAAGGYLANKLDPAWTSAGVFLGMMAGGKEKQTVIEKHTIKTVIPPDPVRIAAAEERLESAIARRSTTNEVSQAEAELEAAIQDRDGLERAEKALLNKRGQTGSQQPGAMPLTPSAGAVNFCVGCGAKIASGVSFCSSCGRACGKEGRYLKRGFIS